jgi:hypothetical protein
MTALAIENNQITVSEVKNLQNELKIVFSEVNNGFREHLDSINENTSEIQANYEYMAKLDSKMNKLNERLDNIQLFLRGLAKADDLIKNSESESSYEIQPLTDKEKKVFLVLYTHQGRCFSYSELSEMLNLSVNLVVEFISCMIEKGVPLLKTYNDRKPYFTVDSNFKDHQAKTNILKITQKVLIQ